jgi:hypothetical protein
MAETSAAASGKFIRESVLFSMNYMARLIDEQCPLESLEVRSNGYDAIVTIT